MPLDLDYTLCPLLRCKIYPLFTELTEHHLVKMQACCWCSCTSMKVARRLWELQAPIRNKHPTHQSQHHVNQKLHQLATTTTPKLTLALKLCICPELPLPLKKLVQQGKGKKRPTRPKVRPTEVDLPM